MKDRVSRGKKLTVLRTGLAYDKIIIDVNKREVRSGTVEQNWKNYIDIARGLLGITEMSRMAIAEIATRATILRCGGDRHSLNWKTSLSKLTVKAFANEIGVKPNTLWLWIKIKTRVFDNLAEKERQKFKHDDGEKTFKLLGSKKTVDIERTKELYKAIANQTPEQRRANRVIIYLMNVRKVLTKNRNLLTQEQINGVKLAVLELLKLLEDRIE